MKKICSTCKEEKELSEFNKNKGKKDGLSTVCRECGKEHCKDYYNKNKEHHLKVIGERNKIARQRNKDFILQYIKGKSCIDCGTKDTRVFEFDHLGDKIKDVSVLVSGGYSVKKIKQELEKCEIVCANCHRIRTFERSDCYRNILP